MNYFLDLEKIPSSRFPFCADRLTLLNHGDIQEVGGGSIGSVDLTKVVGVTHPNYGGLDWGTLKPVENRARCYLKRSREIMENLKTSPEYYLDHNRKDNWSFYKIGNELYVNEGVHRTVLARLFLNANNLPEFVHGVTITTALWKDKVKGDYINQSTLVNSGLYVGDVRYVTDSFVCQKINRNGDLVRHDAYKLSAAVKVGDVVEISYKDGVGIVGGKSITVGVGR